MSDQSSVVDAKKWVRRKTVLINPKLQLSLVGWALFIFVFAAVIFYSAMSYTFLRLEFLGAELDLEKGHQYFRMIKELEGVTAWVFGLNVFLGIIVIYMGGLYLSHKVAGPLFYFNRRLKEFAEGAPLEPVKFRKGDFFFEVQESFNRFVETVKKKNV